MVRFTRSLVPNFLTLANLFSGFIAIVYISKDMYMLAGLFVLIAAIFDMLDGITARLIKSASEFGVELDSLSDAVSFGVVPSFMLYKIYFYQFNDIGIFFSALPLICGVLRLARFNIQITVFEDKKFFTGLAIPAGAFIILSYILFYHLDNDFPDRYKEFTLFAVTIVVSLLMISTIKFYNVPRPNKKYIKENPIHSLIFLGALFASIVTKGKFVFPFFVFYLFGCVIRHYFLKIKHFYLNRG